VRELTQRHIKLLSGSYTLQFFNTWEQTQKKMHNESKYNKGQKFKKCDEFRWLMNTEKNLLNHNNNKNSIRSVTK